MSDLESSELIDTSENKPKIDTNDDIETSDKQTNAQASQSQRVIESKTVSKLTNEEREYLINLYKNGGEDTNFKVTFLKNGNNRITRRKQQQSLSSKLLSNSDNAKYSKQPSLTNEQLLLEHVIDLETKFATLQQKHKKLKKYYKSLHEDIYIDENDINSTEVKTDNQTVTNNDNECVDNQNTNDNNIDNNNADQNFRYNYVNRIRRQPKGYRRMLSLNGC